ncbi:Carboxylesterase NlhH [Caulifigura coniformis]|uniref:Carboxylesterase NlhH n=1 Tax=Caulifigura coniformis TaxID=2527983 RepID=A0A517SFI6_9PLAN|nr:alpha/beta hydrolase [Caulifigura coniformis]QDT54894.1 Carboxylesterase NlhH [Caulifigura coniformis]
MNSSPRRAPLDHDAVRFLERLKAAGLPPIHQIPLAQARAGSASTVVTADPIGHVEDLSISGPEHPLKLRIYRPEADARAPGRLPVIIFFHGGGWVFGSLDSHDGLCRRMCRLTGCAVVSVDYRLAPEHPFPAAVHDAQAAIRWVAAEAENRRFDAARLVVCGDSAGANLATVAGRNLAGEIQVAAQVLWYPVTSFGMETPSYLENREGYFLTRAEMDWFTSQYLPRPEDARHPDAAPLLAEDLSALPPTYLLTAGYDPLRDDGRAYAKRLIDAGVTVHFTERRGLIHGFMRRLDDFQTATDVLRETDTFLRSTFGAAREPGDPRTVASIR